MKKRKVNKLIRKAAKDGGIQVDFITGGKRTSVLHGSDDFGGVSIFATRGDDGKIRSVDYAASRRNNSLDNYDIYLPCSVDNGRKFMKAIGREIDNLLVNPETMNAFANKIDRLPGMANNDMSTYVSLNEGEYSLWA